MGPILALMGLVKACPNSNKSNRREKILVLAKSLVILDIVQAALATRKIEALRYNRTVSKTERARMADS